MKTFGESAFNFLQKLTPNFNVPTGIELLLPFNDKNVRAIAKQFYSKFYDDSNQRIFVLGINPGRLGAGTTGIAFTDPVNLERFCGIKTNLSKSSELSSSFIYQAIEKYGGTESFFNKFFLTAVCPIGFTRNGKNMNYYDDKELEKETKDFIIKMLLKQIGIGANKEVAICLGEGKNYSYLSKLNSKYAFFKKIIPLPHPRFIMQYKRKQLNYYLDMYMDVLNSTTV